MMVCTDALPNDRVPRMVARLWSCSAPATISEAEAEPPLISTISGLPLVRSPGRALKRCVSSGLRPRVETISPLVEEGVGHRDRLIEQAARIVAQVEDIALELVAHLARQFVDRLVQAVGRLFIELRQSDIADVIALRVRARRCAPG